MLRLRPYRPGDAAAIVTWIRDEYAFRQWCADRFEHYPLTPDALNAHYSALADADWFYPMTAFDENGISGHLIMRFTDEQKTVLRFGFVIVDAARRGQGYGKEMLGLALKMAFEILKAETVTLGVFRNNPAALYCYKAAGFQEIAPEKPEYYRIFGEDWECIELKTEQISCRIDPES